MPENDIESYDNSLGTSEEVSPESPTDEELYLFASEATQIEEEANALNLTEQAKIIGMMERFYNDLPKFSHRKSDIGYLRERLEGSSA
jgi:hypothetical protein